MKLFIRLARRALLKLVEVASSCRNFLHGLKRDPWYVWHRLSHITVTGVCLTTSASVCSASKSHWRRLLQQDNTPYHRHELYSNGWMNTPQTSTCFSGQRDTRPQSHRAHLGCYRKRNSSLSPQSSPSIKISWTVEDFSGVVNPHASPMIPCFNWSSVYTSDYFVLWLIAALKNKS